MTALILRRLRVVSAIITAQVLKLSTTLAMLVQLLHRLLLSGPLFNICRLQSDSRESDHRMTRT